MDVTFLADADRTELERMISEHTGGAVTIESILQSTADGGENIVTFSRWQSACGAEWFARRKRSGLKKRITPHVLRYTTATQTVSNDMRLRVLVNYSSMQILQ